MDFTTGTRLSAAPEQPPRRTLRPVVDVWPEGTPSDRPPAPAGPPAPAPARAPEHGEHRRLLVGDLVIRRVTYRSVAGVALPFLASLYAIGLGIATLAWNVAALAGWSPESDGLEGATVFWLAVVVGVVLVPVGVLVLLGLTGLYNAVCRGGGGIEVAIVSPRQGHRRYRDT